MSEKQEFEKRKMYIFSNYVYWLFLTNILFGLAILPSLLVIVFIEPVIRNVFLYLITFLPIGPALGALAACMIQVVEKRELSPAIDYWKYYKRNWKDSLRLWSLFLAAATILLVDIFYVNELFSLNTTLFSVLFFLLFALLILFIIPTFLIMVKFSFAFKDLLKLGFLYTVTRFKITTGNACIVFLTLFIMYRTIDFLPVLFASVLVFVIVHYNHDTLKDIQQKYIQ